MELGCLYYVGFRLTLLRQLGCDWVPSNDRNLVVTRQFMSQATAHRFVNDGPFEFELSDGNMARIEACSLSEPQRNRMVRESEGFAGYEWMVDSIIKHGQIVENTPSR